MSATREAAADLVGSMTLQLLEEATAAATGSAVATTTLYPLELTKTRLVSRTGDQMVNVSTLTLLKQIVADRGLAGLYQGLSAKVSHGMLQSFAYFYLYTFAKKLLVAQQRWRAGRAAGKAATVAGASAAAVAGAVDAARAAPQSLSTVSNLVAGYLAAVAGTAITLPLEVFTTKYQVAPAGTSPAKVLASIRDKGVAGFYTGFRASLFLCINPAINYTVFEQLKSRWLAATGGRRLSVSQAFLLGVVAKIVATLATYPQIRAKLIQQSGTLPDTMSMTAILRMVLRTEGATGLYKGLRPQLLRTVLASALMLTAKERIARRTSALLAVWVLMWGRLLLRVRR